MATKYPDGIDNTTSLPYITNGMSPMVADDINRLRDAVVAIETELGADPSGTLTSVRDRFEANEQAMADYASAEFLVLSHNGFTSSERKFVPSPDFITVDGGPGFDYTIDLADVVGIGTSTPSSSYSLTLNGNGTSRVGGFTLRNNSVDTLYIGNPTASDSSNVEVFNPRPGYMRFATSNAERMRIDASGKVGIGTNNPTNILHLKGLGEIASLETTGTTGNNYLRFKNGTSNLGYFGWGSAGNNHLNISNEAVASDITLITSGFERMRITSTGNVGVGTAAPTAGLHVDASKGIKSNGITHNYNIKAIGVEGDPCNGTFAGYLILAKKHPNPFASTFVDASYVIGKIYIRRGTAGSGHRVDVYEVVSSIGYNGESFYVNAITPGGGSSFFVQTVSCIYGGTRYHALQLTQTGGNPSTEITFEGVAQDSPLILTDASFVTNIIGFGQFGIMQAGGNVGIGTSNPAARLDVDSASNAWARWRSSSTTGSFMSFVKGGTSTNIGYIGTDAGGIINGGVGDNFGIRSEYDLLLMAGSAERARINSAGNLGIGTTNPLRTLDVFGEMRLSTGLIYRPDNLGVALSLGNGTNTHFGDHIFKDGVGTNERMRITDGGNVGIGTPSPVTPLNVAGEIRGNNFGDNFAGSFNVNLGSGNLEGRGLVAGYSGSSYGGIGYNVRHSPTSSTYTAPLSDTSNYLLMNQGFTFYGAGTGTAGRNLLYDNTTQLMRIGNDGNLVVKGTITATGYNGLPAGVAAGGAAGSVQFNGGSGSFAGDSNFTWNNSDKRLGIGTASPATRLHISGQTGLTLETVNAVWADIGANVATSNYLKLRRPGTTDALGYIGGGSGGAITGGSANDLVIRSEDALRLSAGGNAGSGTGPWARTMTLLANGNVGIGTENPSTKLEVFDNVNAPLEIKVSNNGSGLYSNTVITTVNNVSRICSMGIKSPSSISSYAATAGEAFLFTDSPGIHIHAGNNIKFSSESAEAEVMRIESNGFVGIGTTSPAKKLHVASGGARIDGTVEASALNVGDGSSSAESYSFGGSVGTGFGRDTLLRPSSANVLRFSTTGNSWYEYSASTQTNSSNGYVSNIANLQMTLATSYCIEVTAIGKRVDFPDLSPFAQKRVALVTCSQAVTVPDFTLSYLVNGEADLFKIPSGTTVTGIVFFVPSPLDGILRIRVASAAAPAVAMNWQVHVKVLRLP